MRRGEEFLVVHRSPRGGAYWHGIAGGLEAGESFAEAAARELYEETGLRRAAGRDRRAVRLPGRLQTPHGITVGCFLVDVPDGWEPTLNDEHDEYRWCSRDDAVELLYWPEPKELLRAL